ncbi:hypothetical protein pW2_178 [Bacillus phage pW2]|uniref:Uncharacterized protein n=1 Tax=Bacillus phage pW2 TaxID=2500559 RepID=A0A3Q9R7I4_9CAUD|nr:hypothetical protein PQE69_gp126 [Bacillus phage pW2]AZU98992.1 hypothetical protein pW2_178 [Bacillus phage pW2]
MDKENWCYNCDNHFDDCECWECEECGDEVENGEKYCRHCKPDDDEE